MRVGIALIEGYSFTHEPVELGAGGLGRAASRLEALGFDLIIAPETAGHDPFFPLVLAAEHTGRLRLGTGIAVAFPRSPMVVAQMSWDLQRFSAGRFELGLGTQVKGHNERRYGVPWHPAPGPRMREYLECLGSIFHTFQNPDDPRYYEGEAYRFTMLGPVFAPEPIEHPEIPIQIAAVNPYMCRLGGELANGVFAHPCCTAKYIREVMLPEIAKGAAKAGRAPEEVDIIGAPMVVTARDEEGLARERELLKQRVAFYGSTRSYHSVFECHGWKDMGERLHAMSLEGKWKEMAALIPDEMAEEFGTIGLVDDIGDLIAERWGGLLTTFNLPTDFPLAGDGAEHRIGTMLDRLHGTSRSSGP